ncbi:DUF2279 domain-containing protein, partial [bacterium]|nr:DUF2279 domain-containing protein [bacterium]
HGEPDRDSLEYISHDSIPLIHEKGCAIPLLLQHPAHIIPWRCGVSGALLVGATYYAFDNMPGVWGPSVGKFHIKKHDWDDDLLVYTDEISHLLVSYKLTQACKGLFGWCGFSPKFSRIIGATSAFLWMTAVEYPVDAYNPKQGLGYSDLVFDYIGIALAYFRDQYEFAKRFDFKLSLETTDYYAPTIVAMTLEEANNYIYWLTFQPDPSRIPLHVGLGYSGKLKVATERKASPQGYLGVGISLSDLSPLLGPEWGKFLDIFGFYSFSIYIEIF